MNLTTGDNSDIYLALSLEFKDEMKSQPGYKSKSSVIICPFAFMSKCSQGKKKKSYKPKPFMIAAAGVTDTLCN